MKINEPNILCLSLTPALDRYLTIDTFEFGKINRFNNIMERAGGKSINGARAIKQLGGIPFVLTMLGGYRGKAISEYAKNEKIDLLSVHLKSETRQYTEIWDETNLLSTHLSEQWNKVMPEEWRSYLDLVREIIKNKKIFSAAIISGGIPPGIDKKEAFYLAKMLVDSDILCLVDSAGETLEQLLEAKPDVVKINKFEAGNHLHFEINSIFDAAKACKTIMSQGIGSCVITLGEMGAVGAKGSQIYHVEIDNKGLMPVGSGDSFLGALAVNLAKGENWLQSLIAGSAAGTANAHCRISGMLDEEKYEIGLKTAKYKEIKI